MKSLHWFWALIVLALVLDPSGFLWSEARAQQDIEILQKRVDYTFGGQVTFWAKANWNTPPARVQIFYKSIDQTNTIVGEVTVRGNELVYVHDLVRYPLKAFSEIQYYYGIQIEGESPFISPTFSFIYDDNRYSWQLLEEQPFRVHWYDGDLEFGQTVLDVARGALKNAQRLLGFPNPEKVDIFVYANSAEMQSALNLGSIPNVAGRASPELGVMVVSIPPGPSQQTVTEENVPHELMHILLYKKLVNDYADLPTWLSEGLASLNETYRNPEHTILLQDAFQKDSFLPISSLCRGFPLDGGKFQLSYAEAESFTRYLNDEYGAEVIQALIQAYANGVDCERGAEIGAGKSLTQLDEQWQHWLRQDLHQNPVLKALGEVLPWAAIFLLILLTPILLIITSVVRRKADAQKVDERPAMPGG